MRLSTKKIVLISSALLLSGCSSDPYANGGGCETPGVYKKIENKLAVCAGLEGKFKYYFEGPHFDAIYLLGKSEYDILNFDSEEPFHKLADERGLSDLTWRTKWNISNDEIANFAQGDSRWDGLIEANSKVIALESEFKFANTYRFEMLNDFRAGKVSRQIAYEAQQDVLKISKKVDSAMEIYSQKLAVLRAEIKTLYGVTDYVEPMLFVVVKQHNL
jgi:hypothetical protein